MYVGCFDKKVSEPIPNFCDNLHWIFYYYYKWHFNAIDDEFGYLYVLCAHLGADVGAQFCGHRVFGCLELWFLSQADIPTITNCQMS